MKVTRCKYLPLVMEGLRRVRLYSLDVEGPFDSQDLCELTELLRADCCASLRKLRVYPGDSVKDDFPQAPAPTPDTPRQIQPPPIGGAAA